MRQVGTVINWKDVEGYGFIQPDTGGQVVFFHVKKLVRPGGKRPADGDRIEYTLDQDEFGRPFAANPRLLNAGSNLATRPFRQPEPTFGFGPVFAVLFLAALTYGTFVEPVFPLWVWAGYAFLSLLQVIAYRTDKQAAEMGEWRTPEHVLHLKSLLGGWPGALFAQSVLRHKSSKESFKSMALVMIVANLLGLGLLVLASESLNRNLVSALGQNRAKPFLFPLRNQASNRPAPDHGLSGSVSGKSSGNPEATNTPFPEASEIKPGDRATGDSSANKPRRSSSSARSQSQSTHTPSVARPRRTPVPTPRRAANAPKTPAPEKQFQYDHTASQNRGVE